MRLLDVVTDPARVAQTLRRQGPFAARSYGFAIVDVGGASITQTLYNGTGTQLHTTTFAAAGSSVNFANLAGLVVY